MHRARKHFPGNQLNVPAENFPFCTLEPNTARVPVPVSQHDLTPSCEARNSFNLVRCCHNVFVSCAANVQDKRYDQLVKVWNPKKR